jgi:acetoacetyl-CoA synthetase
MTSPTSVSMTADASAQAPIWRPDSDAMRRSHLQQFLQRYRDRLSGDDYAALHAWSVADPAGFWGAVWRDCGVVARSPARHVVQHFDRMPGARWFEGASLNYAENLLAHRGPAPAIVFQSETGERRVLSRDELASQVMRLAAALEARGVRRGDRVAGFLPNCPETVIAMLATTALGAVWSSCSPDFGVEAVLDRFGQISPKILFAADGYFYGGKRLETLTKAMAIAERLDSLSGVVIVSALGPPPDLQAYPTAVSFDDLLQTAPRPDFTPIAFGDPGFILHSSGTTGRPKCIVHSAGGTLIQHLKEHQLHTDLHPGDVLFYFTTCGWMMWNWLVSALASAATIVLYDGSPFHPDPGVLWRLAERERVNVFGTSAKYLSALEKSGYRPREQGHLEALRAILSTGSTLAPSSYDFVHQEVKPGVQLCSISGGTELISCFALGNPILPVYRGELQCLGLGMKVEIFNERGEAVRQQKGELVCTAPFPSMPIGFWDDPADQRYHATYFERFPDVWCHGDFAELTAHGGLIIYGRSDAVLNPGGVRIGTAEIYRVVERFPEIAESIAVGQDWEGDVRVVLFLRLQPGCQLDAALEERLRREIRAQASPRHVPAKILTVRDIPRTINGKIVELAVREAIHGRPVGNTDVLANPAALEEFKNRPELSAG